jgi:predicted nucleic acid-binding protein
MNSAMSAFVIADASPLIGLAAARAFHVLRALYGTVTITRLVKDEVAGHAGRPGARELTDAMRAGWVRVAPAPPETWGFPALDPGEASTIALAREHANSLVLMDDTLGREQAVALGLDVLGLAGVLLEAKRAGIIHGLRPLLERLARRGFVLPDEELRTALAAAAESLS